jgi:hypothetical protein
MWSSSHSNTANLVLFGRRVCSSLNVKGKNTTKFNNICEVFQLEHPRLASNRGTHMHTEKSRREWGCFMGLCTCVYAKA